VVCAIDTSERMQKFKHGRIMKKPKLRQKCEELRYAATKI
jgi:hypothetical protein